MSGASALAQLRPGEVDDRRRQQIGSCSDPLWCCRQREGHEASLFDGACNGCRRRLVLRQHCVASPNAPARCRRSVARGRSSARPSIWRHRRGVTRSTTLGRSTSSDQCWVAAPGFCGPMSLTARTQTTGGARGRVSMRVGVKPASSRAASILCCLPGGLARCSGTTWLRGDRDLATRPKPSPQFLQARGGI